MNGSIAKAARRDLRRALGDVATDTLQDNAKAIAILTNSVQLAHREIADLKQASADDARKLTQLDSLITLVESHLETQRADFLAHTKRSFWQRMIGR